MTGNIKLTAREEFFSTPRGEREQFEEMMGATLEEDHQIILPLTYDGFEALMELITDRYQLPLDDAGRSIIAGFVHHLDNDVVSTPLSKLGKVLGKSIANNMTWHVDQKLKQAAKKLLEEEEAAAKAEALKLEPNPNLHVIPSDSSPPEDAPTN